MIGTVLVFEGQGARTVPGDPGDPGDPEVELATLRPVDAQTAIVCHQVHRAERYRAEGGYAVVGQSLGEISALVVAGALTLDDALEVVRLRAELPHDLLEPRTWTMASLTRITPADAEAAADDLTLWVINENGPADCVVVGDAPSFETLSDRLDLSPTTFRALPVTSPYHTPLMQPVADAMARALDKIDVKAPAVPVMSPTGPREIGTVADVRTVLVDALVSPVAWSTVLRSAAERWPDARWRECGPSGSLYRFVWKNGLKLDWAEAEL